MYRLLLATTLLGALSYGQNNDFHPNREGDNSRRDYPESIPGGTSIEVRTNQSIDVRDHYDHRVYTGTINSDVANRDGVVMIPRGSQVELMINNVGDQEMVIDMESVSINGRRYMVSAKDYQQSRRSGVGENKRTGEFVGGGALFGTLLGAIAGGGKGAAIGALAGGAAGAGGETVTRGREIRIPAESILNFRLERPFEAATGDYSRDRGVDRDGNHYHDDYYRRQP